MKKEIIFRGTKGKWVLRENKSTIMSEEKCLIARVFDGKGIALLADKNQNDTIVEANALLISKAPELLEMLIDLRDCKETWSDLFQSDKERIEQLIKEATEI